MNEIDIRDGQISKAIVQIQNRAERHPDSPIVNELYVDFNLIGRLKANKNEIINGRRGTGKTHLLRAFEQDERLTNMKSQTLYINCNELDSGRAPRETPVDVRANLIFNRILEHIYNHLFFVLTNLEKPSPAAEMQIFKALAKFNDFCVEYSKGKIAEGVGIYRALDEVLDAMGCQQLYVVLDEWVSLEDLQPYVAEKIRKVFISSRKICFKIASIEYRSTMQHMADGKKIGIEIGADFFSDVDLDDFLVYDKDKEHVEKLFALILFNHIFVSLPGWDKNQKLPEDEKIEMLRTTFFTERRPFIELVRAGEGVVRDFLQIFTKAYFSYFYPNQDLKKIGMDAVRRAARDWYQKDKSAAILGQDDLNRFLSKLVSHVIKGRKVKSFLVEQKNSKHPIIQRLFDARVLHLTWRGWSSKDEPGKRYDIFTIDYGTYVD
ncbi:MAG: hypothetical protein ABL927_12750, partial [Bdellovibrionales bacterium]